MTDRTARRRRHPAASSRFAAAGMSAALTFGIVTALSWPMPVVAEPEAVALAPADIAITNNAIADSVATEPATAPRVVQVVVRRHHPVPTEPRIVRVQAPAPAAKAQTRSAPAPAPAPAPRPRTRSGGS